MNKLSRPLCAALERLRAYSRSGVEATQREVDVILHQTLQNARPSWHLSFSYARCVVLGSLYRPAVHIAAVAILAIVIGSGIFIPFSSADVMTRLTLIFAAMAVGTILSYLLIYLLLSTHIRFRISLWAIAGLHSLASAILFCLIEPEIIRYFQAYTVPTFSEIFFPILLLYGLADFFVLWQFKEKICALSYTKKHKTDHIETLLPAKLRGDVFLMSSADHYVEFFTEQGSHLHRMTMKAAVAKRDKAEGMRVHRSHWVAYSAMLTIEKCGERYFLTLRNGQRVPVSQQNAAKVACFLDVDCQYAAE